MYKNDNKFIDLNSSERRSMAILYGYRELYRTDFDNYLIYKNNKIDSEIPEYNLSEMKVLDTLNELGFPMDYIGTLIYKDVIMATKSDLEEIINCGIIEKYEFLKETVENPYSEFYLNISRWQNDISVERLHNHIMNAIKSIDKDKINVDTVYKIFGSNNMEHSYGKAAIKIGLYSFGMRAFDIEKREYEMPESMPKIKQISSLKK